jgi:tetratricopeptide (TPR) repeat protein
LDRAEAYDQFALYHNDAGEWERARRALRQAGDLLRGSSDRLADAHHHEASGDLQWGDPASALGEYASALTLLDGSEALATERARVIRKIAGALIDQGKLDEAAQKVADANSLIRDKPTSPEGAFLLCVSGQIELARHNDLAAIAYFQEAIDRFSKVVGGAHRDLPAGLGLGQTLQMMGDAERRRGLAHAYDSYDQAIRSLEPVLADDPTLLDALRSTELARRGLRLLSMTDKNDAAREARLNRAKSDFEAAFGQGIDKFRYGMTTAQTNLLLQPAFSPASLSNLPRAWEYKTSDVRYFCRWFGDRPPEGVGCGAGIQAKDLTLSLFPSGSACMLNSGYAVFMFSDNTLFRIVVRFLRSTDPCPERLASVDEFARRYSITASGAYGTRRLRYETDKVGLVAISDDNTVAFDFEQR